MGIRLGRAPRSTLLSTNDWSRRLFMIIYRDASVLTRWPRAPNVVVGPGTARMADEHRIAIRPAVCTSQFVGLYKRSGSTTSTWHAPRYWRRGSAVTAYVSPIIKDQMPTLRLAPCASSSTRCTRWPMKHRSVRGAHLAPGTRLRRRCPIGSHDLPETALPRTTALHVGARASPPHA